MYLVYNHLKVSLHIVLHAYIICRLLNVYVVISLLIIHDVV